MNVRKSNTLNNEENGDSLVSFKDLGLVCVLEQACTLLGWKVPARIQQDATPLVLEGRNLMGIEEFASGKIGAFTSPLLLSLLENPQKLFGLVLTCTQKLAFCAAAQIEGLGSGLGVRCAVAVAGADRMKQTLAKEPHIIVTTPSIFLEQLLNTDGLNLSNLKFLIIVNADELIDMGYEDDIYHILEVIPRERRTLLFSSIMTSKVNKLIWACRVHTAKN